MMKAYFVWVQFPKGGSVEVNRGCNGHGETFHQGVNALRGELSPSVLGVGDALVRSDQASLLHRTTIVLWACVSLWPFRKGSSFRRGGTRR